MINSRSLLLLFMLQPLLMEAQLGSSCGSPHVISLDGVRRTYNSSSTTGGAVVCSNGNYPNTSPVTWFSVTTNAAAEMPLLDITAGDSSSCEVAMYTACNGGSILQTSSSICFDDGWGLWAPAHNYTLLPNTTYRIRVKTSTATTISIRAQNYTPPNNTCSGATPVDSARLRDHNACHRPSNEVLPSQLCAYSLENTAFYQFFIRDAGPAIINISNISCDNGSFNNANGFQIGFFTGTCGALTPLTCTAGSGSFVQATTPILAAGTKVYVAIDGEAGSNCQYELQAINAVKVLSHNEFKNFAAWKNAATNTLKWRAVQSAGSYFEIERSANGSDFISIGRVYGKSATKEMDYAFEDHSPLKKAFYRIRAVYETGGTGLSNTIRVERNDPGARLRVMNPVAAELRFELEMDSRGQVEYAILSAHGQVQLREWALVSNGVNQITTSISGLPRGMYIISVTNGREKLTAPFVKL